MFFSKPRSLTTTANIEESTRLKPELFRKGLYDNFSDKLLTEYSANCCNDLNTPQDILLEQMKKERDLLIAVYKLTNYRRSILNRNEDWVYDSGPFRLAGALEQDPVALLLEEIENYHLFELSTAPLMLEIEEHISESLEVIKNYYIKEQNEIQFSVDILAIENQAKELLCNLLLSPALFDQDELQNYLSVLCSLNAHNLLQVICKMAPEQIDLSLLLSKALRYLNFETVKVLVNLGADINKTMLLYCDLDSDIKICGPTFMFPFLTLMYDCHSFLQLPQDSSALYFRPDHPKLMNILLYLLQSGAEPTQKVIFESFRPIKNIEESEDETSASESYFEEKSITEIAQHLLKEELKNLTPEFGELIRMLANWSLDTRIQYQVPTLEGLQSFKRIVDDKLNVVMIHI